MKDVTSLEFSTLQKEGKKILLDLWAPWCGPCRMLIPRLEQMSENYNDVEFVKINVDENRDFAMTMGIRNVPTVIIFNGGEEISRMIGAKGENEYKEILDNL